MNEIEARRQITQGEQAAQVVANPAYKKAIADIKLDLLEKFERTEHRHIKRRNEIWLELKMLGKIQEKLEDCMASGKIASHSITDKLKNITRW